MPKIVGTLEMPERSAPGAPAADTATVYARDDGVGNTIVAVKRSDNTETVLTGVTYADFLAWGVD